MKALIFLVGLSSLLAGCIADRDKPGMNIKYDAVDAAKSLVTPEIIKDCSDRIARQFTTVTVAGSFFLSAKAAARVGDVQLLPSGPNDDIVALVAPSTNPGLMGRENKGYVGCSYRLQNGRLAFRAVHSPGELAPKSITVVY
jgi:hypothetical protein